MSADLLHSRIASELSRRLEVAKAATPGPWRGADWSASFGSPEETVTAIESSHRGPFPQIVLREEQPALVLHVEDDGGDFNANVAHIALHDPADSIRRYSSALALLAEINSWAHHVNQNSYFTCPLALDDDGETLCSDDTAVGCQCGLDERRTAVLLLVAASLGLDTEGSTTDG